MENGAVKFWKTSVATANMKTNRNSYENPECYFVLRPDKS